MCLPRWRRNALSRIAATAIALGTCYPCALAGVGDFDGDGRADVLLRHGESGAWIYYAVDGQRALLRRVGLTRNPSYRFRGIGDFDGDRRDDVLLRHAASGEWIYYGLDGVRAVLHRARVTRNLSYDYVGAGDFDGYGRDHVLLRHADTGEWIYYALDSGRAVLHRVGLTRNLSYAPAGVGDFDRDGRDDVLLRHADNGSWIYYALDGGRAVLHRVGLTRNPSYVPAGVGDFDRDGRDDVLLRHADNGSWIYYALDGGRAVLHRIGLTRNLSYAAAGIGDFDGDGRDDVLLRHATSGEWIYYALDGRRAVLQRLGATRNLAWAPPGREPGMAPPTTMLDDGDTEATATAVDVPSIRLARLETSEDTDYFRIELPGSGRLRAYTTGSTNTSGKLTSADGSVSERNDDSGEGSNFRLVEDVPAGTYFVRVTGYRGATGVYTLHVAFEADGAEVRDDHGDTADTATGVGVPSTTSGQLEASGDVDYFRLILGRSGTLSAHTTGMTDTSGELVREDGTPVAGDADGSDGANFRIAEAVTAGVYLVRVSGARGATGSYTLHMAFEAGDVEAGDDYGDTPDAATAVGVPSSTAGRLEATGDIDYFRLVLDRPGTLSAYTTGTTNTQGELSGDDGSVLGTDDDGGTGPNFRIDTDVTAGMYLVRVRGSGRATGAYTLHVAFEAGDIEVADDHGDTPDRASVVAVPSSTAGRLGSADDADYFRIELNRAGTLRAYTTGSTNTSGKLTSADGSVSERNDDSGEGTNFRFVEDVSAGTYFVRVTGSRDATGTYTLHVALETDEVGVADDHGDTADAATAVRVPSSTSGRLETSGDEDYFRIVLDEPGSLTVRTTGSTNTSGELTRENGTQVDDDEDSGDGSNFRIVEDVPAGTYYIRVSGDRGATGNYTLRVAFEPDEVGMVDDHGDTADDATAVRVPSSTTGRLETSDDEDYFRIILDEAGSLGVRTTGSTNTSGELTRKDGTLVDNDEDSGDGLNFRIVEDVPAGTYYIRVSGDRGATGAYELHLAFDAEDVEVGDDHGDTAAAATNVAVPSSTAARLGVSDDIDYFRLEVPSRGRLTAETHGDMDTVGRLEDASGHQVASDDDGGPEANFKIEADVTEGTYLVRVSGRGATGFYTLHVAFESHNVSNRAPVADAGRNQDLAGYVLAASLDGSGSSDPDGDGLGYSWKQTHGPATILIDRDSVRPRFDLPRDDGGRRSGRRIAPTREELRFELVVNDGTSDSQPDHVRVSFTRADYGAIAAADDYDSSHPAIDDPDTLGKCSSTNPTYAVVDDHDWGLGASSAARMECENKPEGPGSCDTLIWGDFGNYAVNSPLCAAYAVDEHCQNSSGDSSSAVVEGEEREVAEQAALDACRVSADDETDPTCRLVASACVGETTHEYSPPNPEPAPRRYGAIAFDLHFRNDTCGYSFGVGSGDDAVDAREEAVSLCVFPAGGDRGGCVEEIQMFGSAYGADYSCASMSFGQFSDGGCGVQYGVGGTRSNARMEALARCEEIMMSCILAAGQQGETAWCAPP